MRQCENQLRNFHVSISLLCLHLVVAHLVVTNIRLIFMQAVSNVDILETPTDLISFVNGASSDYLLIVETHHRYDTMIIFTHWSIKCAEDLYALSYHHSSFF